MNDSSVLKRQFFPIIKKSILIVFLFYLGLAFTKPNLIPGFIAGFLMVLINMFIMVKNVNALLLNIGHSNKRFLFLLLTNISKLLFLILFGYLSIVVLKLSIIGFLIGMIVGIFLTIFEFSKQ